jgi:hypothetical protein
MDQGGQFAALCDSEVDAVVPGNFCQDRERGFRRTIKAALKSVTLRLGQPIDLPIRATKVGQQNKRTEIAKSS